MRFQLVCAAAIACSLAASGLAQSTGTNIIPLYAVAPPGSAAPSGPSQRYILTLQDPPLSKQVLTGLTHSRAALRTAAAEAQREKLIGAQENLKSLLRQRGISVLGSVNTLANAIFVSVRPERAGELSALPGVSGVLPVVKLHRTLNTALGLINTSAAWTALGGEAKAGAGMKIAILDTGIDETHPGFIDPTLTFPPGFPVSGNANDATHTTTKIIAVRSFVSELAIGDGTPELTLPDDLSARDRVGHGTAVAMIAAGVSVQSPAGTISGVAPKAWLGNYKIFGSPGVNDETSSDVVLEALEAAFNDGFDIALLSAGDLPATWGPADQGATCGLAAGSYCDPFAGAVTAAIAAGMVVVLPAGNDGALGDSTINTPGDVDAAITVGATTNAHIVAATVSTSGGNSFEARLGDGPQPTAAITAPLVPVSTLDNTGYGCQSFPAASLNGTIALVAYGECSLASKVLNAEAAGAVAVLVSSLPTGPQLFSPTGLGNTGIPTALISSSSGTALGQYVASNNGGAVTLDSTPAETTPATSGQVAYFSSRGPDIRDSSIKPDVAAPGASIFTATQMLDPNGDLYNPARYTGVDGTSFAAAFAAGAAALVLQAHPSYSPAQVKSALLNTASSGITDFDANGNPIVARSIAVGGGQLNAGAAVASTLTVVPSSVSFGVLSTTLPQQTLVITNTGAAAANVQFTVTPRDTDNQASVTVTPSTVSLPPGASANLTVALSGSSPAPGFYEGSISASGGAVALEIPYLYIAANGNPTSLIPLSGRSFVTETGSAVDLSFDVLDQSAAPVANEPLRFAPNASVYAETPTTDPLGIGEAYMDVGPVGDETFSADLLTNAAQVEFDGRVRLGPEINANGVVDGASFAVPAGGFAPGSFVTIQGTGLSEAQVAAQSATLPISQAGVSVGFDETAANLHVPAPLEYVSPAQVNLQIPWELAGTSSATMKLTLSNSSSKTVRPDDSELGTYQSQMITVSLAQYSPAFFQYMDATTGKLLADALDEQYQQVTPANPVAPGQYIQFFLNGLGAVAPGTQPATGAPSPGGTQLATTVAQPAVTIGGQPASVAFSGLAPYLVGIYQVNVIVPQSTPSGIQPVQLTIGGVTAQSLVAVE
jgi:minor extracellular serine protease Vpr